MSVSLLCGVANISPINDREARQIVFYYVFGLFAALKDFILNFRPFAVQSRWIYFNITNKGRDKEALPLLLMFRP